MSALVNLVYGHVNIVIHIGSLLVISNLTHYFMDIYDMIWHGTIRDVPLHIYAIGSIVMHVFG